MNPQVSDLWLSMALDIVKAARDRMFVQEFDRRAKLLPHMAGAGYIDRLRVLDELIEEQVIGVDERHLILGKIDGVEWIMSGLESGNEVIWTIAEIVDRRGRVVRKFDNDGLSEIGQIGELAVVHHLHRELPESRVSHVKHVSQVDDSLGYDIVAPSLKVHDMMQLLEVKTSVRPGDNFNLFISRNEYRVGLNNPNWSLVCVQIVRDHPKILGHLPITAISDRFPIDHDDLVKWASCRVTIPRKLLIDGLP